jgi:DNA-binding transcriptional ArsR family regulator
MSNRVFPEALPDIAASAAVLADPSRAAMCAALMDGRAWTVGELGAYTGLARSTASEHVDVLVGCGLAAAVRQGRHRYIRLAGEDVANVIEALGVIAGGTLPTPPSLRAWTANKSLREGRTCYRHLAGALGVRLSEQLEAHGFIDDHWQPTASGIHLLDSWGILTDPGALGRAVHGLHRAPLPPGRTTRHGNLPGIFRPRMGSHACPGNKRAAQLTPSGSAALRAADLNVDQHSDS